MGRTYKELATFLKVAYGLIALKNSLVNYQSGGISFIINISEINTNCMEI